MSGVGKRRKHIRGKQSRNREKMIGIMYAGRLATNALVDNEAAAFAPDSPVKEAEANTEREPEDSRKNSWIG